MRIARFSSGIYYFPEVFYAAVKLYNTQKMTEEFLKTFKLLSIMHWD